MDNLNTHQSEALVSYIGELVNTPKDLLGEKGDCICRFLKGNTDGWLSSQKLSK